MDILNERILPLFDKSGKSDMELEREIGLPRSIIYDWRNGRSKSFKKYAGEIASYFDVPADYVLGKEQKNKPFTEVKDLSQEAINLAKQIEELSPANRAKLQELIGLYLSAQDKNK